MSRPLPTTSRPAARLAPAATALLAALAGALPAAAHDDLRPAWRATGDVGDAIVLVEYVLAKPGVGFGDPGQRSDMAAVGTIVTPEGLVVISSNVFPEDEQEARAPARPRDFLVRLADGSRVPASFLGRDRDRALALLQLQAPSPRDFPHVTLDPDARLEAGDPVLIGGLLPERYDHAASFSSGTVARELPGEREIFDVDIFVEDSMIGAPVLDRRGRVAGLLATDPFGQATGGTLSSPLKLIGAVTRFKEPGFPVIVPAASIDAFIASPPLAEGDAPKERSWLGVTLQPVDRPLARYLGIRGPGGVMVTSVWRDSPAERAGFETEDVIVAFDGAPVEVEGDEDLAPFIEGVQRAGVGREVPVVVWRDGERAELQVVLGEAPKSAVRADEYRSETFGLAAQDLTLDVIMGRGWPPETTGTIVTEVETAGWAQVGGLQPGDLILRVDETAIEGIEDLRDALERAEREEQGEVVFFVQRDPDTLFVPVKTSF